MPKPLVETATITETAAQAAKATGRMLVQLISPGWGSTRLPAYVSERWGGWLRPQKCCSADTSQCDLCCS